MEEEATEELPGQMKVPGKRYVAETSAVTALQHRGSVTALGAYDAATAFDTKGCTPPYRLQVLASKVVAQSQMTNATSHPFFSLILCM